MHISHTLSRKALIAHLVILFFLKGSSSFFLDIKKQSTLVSIQEKIFCAEDQFGAQVQKRRWIQDGWTSYKRASHRSNGPVSFFMFPHQITFIT